MIKNINIKNFRCFDELKVSGFEKINLISGKNNVGKTALLEALFLNSAPRPETIIYLLRYVRREQLSFSKSLPERTWNNFFFHQTKNSELIIEATLENESLKRVEICVDESVKDFLEETDEQDSEDEIKDKIISLFSGSESVRSVMHLKTRINQGEAF